MNDAVDNDAMAAEYVLGTLDGLERAQAQVLLSTDEALAAKVRLWERRLGELHLMVEPVEPEAQIWERIKSKLPEIAPSPPTAEDKDAAPAAAAEAVGPIAAAESAVAAVRAAASPPPAPAAPPAPVLPTPTPTPLVPAAALPPAPAAALARALERADESLVIRRRLRRWRAFAMLLLLLLLAAGGLVAVWRYAPERVPPGLRAGELLRLVGVTVAPGRRPAPPESQFDE
jgi:hypothetical protein